MFNAMNLAKGCGKESNSPLRDHSQIDFLLLNVNVTLGGGGGRGVKGLTFRIPIHFIVFMPYTELFANRF